MLNIKKPIHKKIKCFQVNCKSWSNLYLGKVPLNTIANAQKNKILKNKKKKGKENYFFKKVITFLNAIIFCK